MMTPAKKPQILIVDDYPTNIKVLSDLLLAYGFEVLIARDGENALQKLQRITPDLILLDVLMPGIDGFETCQRLQAQESTRDIPIIFMTALSDPIDKIKGLSMGAVDYITKPFQQEEVLARINTHLKIRYLTKQLEEQNSRLQGEARSRQLAESALRLSEEKFAKAFRSNPGPMMLITLAEGRFIEINQNCCDALGYPPEAILGQTLADLNLCHSARDLAQFFSTLQATGTVHNQDYQIRTQSGELRSFLISAEVIQVGEQPCILAMALDMTEAKLAASQLQQAKLAADRANQAKSRFLANISHELRTPLTTILGYSQWMRRDRTLTPEQDKNLSIINQSGEHLLMLINDVLELTKIESGESHLHPQDTDLAALIDDLHEMLAPKAAAKGLLFSVERDPTLPQHIRIDETKLRQVLLNLLSNAIKFTHQGQVTLRVRSPNAPDKTPPAASPAPQTLIFDVADTGPGISPAEQKILFDPFIQTEVGRRSLEGTGLGLTISRHLVQLMQGTLTVTSTLGQGSQFTITLPTTFADTCPLRRSQSQQQVIGLVAGQPSYRILIVDDQDLNRQLLVKLLSAVGFEVQDAKNGAEAIDRYQAWQPHLIWMDVRMPVLDGYAATRHIKQLAAQASSQTLTQPYIIALTANAFEEERRAALDAGYDDFVRKPVQEHLLFEKTAEYLGVRYRYREQTEGNGEWGVGSRGVGSRESGEGSTASPLSPLPSPPLSFSPAVRQALQEVTLGDRAFLAEYLSGHLQELPQLQTALQKAIAQQNTEAIALAAHSLKGMALTFQVAPLARLCQTIEQTSKAGNTVVPALLQQLDIELKHLSLVLQHESEALHQ